MGASVFIEQNERKQRPKPAQKRYNFPLKAPQYIPTHTHTHIHQAMSLLENSLLLVSLYTTLCLTLYLSCGVQGSKSGPSKPLRLPDDVKLASNKPSLHGQPPAKKPRPAPPTEGSSSGGLFSDPIRMSQVSLSLPLSHRFIAVFFRCKCHRVVVAAKVKVRLPYSRVRVRRQGRQKVKVGVALNQEAPPLHCKS